MPHCSMTLWLRSTVLIRALRGFAIVAIGLFTHAAAQDAASVIKSDETIEFFPTAARLTEDGSEWIVPIHGWIYEPERKSLTRRVLIDQMREAIVDMADGLDGEVVEERLWRFVVDNERDKRVAIAIAGQTVVLPASAVDGHFEETVSIPVAALDGQAPDGSFRFRAALSPDDSRSLGGLVRLVQPAGVTVISDIDDTVKVTEVRDRKKLLRNTLAEPFRTVPGMAERYRAWEEDGAAFQFVSGSPWQLHADLVAMLEADKFPPATLALRRVRLKDPSVLELFRSPVEFKIETIEATIAAWPERDCLLIGDSGEKDPEIYGEIARRYPDKVLLIAIRNITEEERDAPRFQEAFRRVDADRWVLFTEPTELPRIRDIPPLPKPTAR